MGVMLFIELQRPIPNLEDELCGKAWQRVSCELDELAKELKLTTLSDLTSSSPEALNELMDDPEAASIYNHEEEWFEAEVGLRTVEGLYVYIKGRKDLLDEWKHAKYILEDMLDAIATLRAAAAAKVRFHFDWAY